VCASRSPSTGMTRDDLFNTNANIVKALTEAVGKYAAACAPLVLITA
jgi:malate/lactate dehydrogenase